MTTQEHLKKISDSLYKRNYYDESNAVGEASNELDALTKERNQLHQDLAKANRKLVLYEAALQSVTDWEKKYPAGKIYSMGDKQRIEAEMTRAHIACIDALKPLSETKG